MAKALIIRGADFSTNKVTTITFADNPCTGLSFSTNSISITGSETVEVEYTVTPTDTTDAITWTSSDTSVVTVSSGVLTAVGIGTATITATCGSYSASATVTVSISYIANWLYGTVSEQSAGYLAYNSSATTRLSAWGSGTQASEYLSPASNEGATRSLIKLPTNTGRVTISYDTTNMSSLNSEDAHIYWASDVSCGASGYTDYALFVSTEDITLRSSGTVTLDVPEGADSLVVVVRITASAASGDAATDAETLGLNIEFLTAA